jgi:hypothetical protein
MMRLDFVLATIMVFVGIVVVALSELMNEGSGDQDYTLRAALASLEANAFIVAFAGVGTMILWLRKRQSIQTPVSRLGEIQTEVSFFRTMEPSLLSGATYKPQTYATDQGGRISLAVKTLLYLVSICIPGFGCMAGGILMANTKPGYGIVGRNCIKAGIASLTVITALIALTYLAIHH